MERREFFRWGAGGVGAVALGGTAAACAVPGGGPPSPTSLFSLGIASGLHSPTEIVCWTRVEPALAAGFDLRLDVATDPAMANVVWSSTHTPDPAADHTVKVKPSGLSPDTELWYRFTEVGGDQRASEVGRARTVPAPGASVTSLRFAYASCQSFANGFYGAWRHIASQDLDAVLFLGDYIYEASTIQLLGIVREEPQETCVTLEDYRARYRLYKSDPDLQMAHAAHPFVPIWDDHEIANDYDASIFLTEAQRAADAYRAWFEFQPVWPTAGTRIYRDHRWGDLAHVFMLDTRQYRDGHSPGAPLVGVRALGPYEAAEQRSILGTTQRSWLLGGLEGAQNDGVPWKVIGNQVMIAPIRTVDLDTPENRALDPNLVKHAGFYSNANFDSWDGFPWERDLILGHLAAQGIENTVFVTGDYHSFWAAAVSTDFDDDAAPLVATDFAAGAISSAGGAFNENLLTGGGYLSTTPGFLHQDLSSNGYGLVEADPGQLEVTFLKHDASYRSALPTPKVRFTLTPGDPVPTQQAL